MTKGAGDAHINAVSTKYGWWRIPLAGAALSSMPVDMAQFLYEYGDEPTESSQRPRMEHPGYGCGIGRARSGFKWFVDCVGVHDRRIGAYSAGSNSYPMSVSFGSGATNEMDTLNVTITYPPGTPCPSGGVGISNPCDGIAGTGGRTCNQVVDSNGESVWQFSQSVSSGYFDYQQVDCGACPYVAYLPSIPEGATVTLSNTPSDIGNALPYESGPYWTYTFRLNDWGSAQPGVTTVSSSNLPANLNVQYV